LVLLPTDGTHVLHFLTTNEPLAIEITKGTNTSTTLAIRYQDLSVPEGVPAQLVFSEMDVGDLALDVDGDGSYETMISPNISVTGDEANDLEPPEIEVSVQTHEDKLLVTLHATDAESGVRSIYYSLDGENFFPYENSLVLDPELELVLYAYADDEVLNRASLVYPVCRPKHKIFLPIIVKD